MLISEFSRSSGLSVDTVRYYVRAGLLSPRQGPKGGRNPYQEFTEEDLHVADIIRFGQALGMSLKDIAAGLRVGTDDQLEILEQKRDALRSRGEELLRMARYLDEKIDWINAGSQGPAPLLQLPGLRKPASGQCA